MAKANKIVHTEVTLTLNNAESCWLREILQNPVSRDESASEAKMRGEVFHALKGALDII